VLPNGVDGFELCRVFAQGSNRTPVLILSARSEKDDRVRGLKLGADDYVVKPFALDELLARIHAVMRRTTPRIEKLKLGDVVIDFQSHEGFGKSGQLELTDRELEVLRHLAERKGCVVTRDELLHLVWGYWEAPTTRTVDNFMFRLRQKIEVNPRNPKYIRTVYGEGYRLVTEE
jgi:DNA-binding response OmpR family regulator